MNPRFDGWLHCGVAPIITTPLGALVGGTRKLINIRAPSEHQVESIEVVLSAAGAATQCTISVFRDATGDVPFVGDGAAGATQTLTTGTTTATDKGAVFQLYKDHHKRTSSSTGRTNQPGGTNDKFPGVAEYVNLWVGILVDGNANLDDVVYNWRA